MSRIAGLAVLAVLMALVAAFPAGAAVPEPPKTPTAVGSGGSAATVDPLATQTAIDVLRSGGNAVDAAVAAAGVLGVTEPFSCGIGGGGFMVIYDAKHRRVDTIDSREAAPADMDENSLVPYKEPQPVHRGLRERAQRRRPWHRGAAGRRRSSATALAPCARFCGPASGSHARASSSIRPSMARSRPTRAIFDDFTSTRELYLDGKTAKPVGAVQRNPDLARTYERIGDDPDRFYRGGIARDIVQTVQHPPEAADSDRPHEVHPGLMTKRDLKRYDAIRRNPTKVSYRGHDVFGMGPPSSGGSTVGEALNILEVAAPHRRSHHGAAPLPRGLQARLRGPQRVRRRPGLRRRAAARPAVRRVRA